MTEGQEKKSFSDYLSDLENSARGMANIISILPKEELKEITDLELKVMKAERGNETLQDKIKAKDEIIKDLKEVIQTLKKKN